MPYKQNNIDFVIPWVDGNDKEWLEEKKKYIPSNKILNTNSRFIDWDNLQYIFRAFEEFTPWVNKIYFITYGHLPKWLNINHPKLVIVKHEDFIDKKYLPLFNVNPLEINLHRIKGLSEKFVYFNDDFFILKPIKPDVFFKNNLPLDFAILDSIHDGSISHMLLNNIDIINKNFNRHIKPEYEKKKLVFKNFFKWFYPLYGKEIIQTIACMYIKKGHTGFVGNHHPQPFLKSTFEILWEKEEKKLLEVSSSKFRTNEDVTQYLFRYWQLVSGNFIPLNYIDYKKTRKYIEIRTLKDSYNVNKDIKSKKYTFYCINDDISKGRYTKEDMSHRDFELSKRLIKEALNTMLPKKSKFEI